MIKRGENKAMMFDLNSENEILVIVCHGGKSAKHVQKTSKKDSEYLVWLITT